MRESFSLGEVAGVRVGVNWSVLVIFGLVLIGLAAGRFPLLYPDRGPTAYVIAGGGAAVVFFLSLLAHEIAHAVLARREGVEVDGITLWMFGGVARLSGDAAGPSAELRISGVGPAVSLGLAAIFGILAWVAQGLADGLVVGALTWLAIINAALAIFNLVPAAPLDGGRILRALLWKRRGDRTSAAVTASRAGRAFGFALVGVGIVTVVVTPGLGGLWLALIGWFIATSAAAEEQHARVRSALEGVRVVDVMSQDPETVPSGITVSQVLEDYVLRSRHSAFPVVGDRGKVIGLVTLNRLKQIDRDRRDEVLVDDVACLPEDLESVGRETPLPEVLTRMTECADGRVVVLEDGHLEGIVSPADVTRMLDRADLRSDADRQHL